MSSPPKQLVTCILTPAGRGAVATVGVSGQGALEAVEKCFQPAAGKPLREMLPLDNERTEGTVGRIVFGVFVSEGMREELVVGLFSSRRVEIHCHGGAAAAQTVVSALTKEGATSVDQQEWASRMETDAIAAEALLALAAARTQTTAAILLDQYQGTLRRKIEEIQAQLLSGHSDAARQGLERLVQLIPAGLHLTTPWRVALAGEPNVGKSSLMNALLGYQRSIIFDQPGTTRDVLSAITALNGWPVELLDTAGLRESADELESAGIERARSTFTHSDLILLVLEAASAVSPPDETLLNHLPLHVPCLTVWNKADLVGISSATKPSSGILASALTGQGIDDLGQAIINQLIPYPPAPGEAVPFTPRHQWSVTRSLATLEQPATAADLLAKLILPQR